MILNFRQLVKYSLISGSISGLFLIFLIPLYGKVKNPWPDSESAIEAQFPESTYFYISFSEGTRNAPSSETSFEIKTSQYLLLPDLIILEVIQDGKTPLELKKTPTSLFYILMYPLILVGMLIIGLKIPDK